MTAQNASSLAVTVTEMKESDLEEVLEIEKKSFADPWSRRLFKETLSFPHSFNFVLRGATGTLLGYVNFYLIAEEAHMLNLAMHPDYRKKGLASKLLDHVIQLLKGRNAAHFFLEVRESNQDAIDLYTKFGFEMIGRRKRYYTKTNEDALVMHLACGSNEHA